MNFFKFPRKSKFFFTGAAAGSNAGGGAAGATSGAAATAGAAGAASGASAGGQAGGQSGGAGSGGSAGAPGAGAAAPVDWTASLSEESRGWVANKQYKSVEDAIGAHRGLEKLLGAPKDRLMQLPDRFYDDQGKLTPEGRAVRERLGAPKEAKEYDLKMPKEGGDPKLLEHFKGLFHELGIPKSDAEKITGSWNSYVEGQMAAAKEASAQAFKDQQAALAKDWGAATEQNTNIAKEAVRTMGITSEQIAAVSSILGHAETMKLFHKFGTQVREAPFVGGGGRQSDILVPDAAKSQIADLKMDREFGKKLMEGDRDAQALWQRLHQQAYPGEYRVS